MAINDTQNETSKMSSDPAQQLIPKTANFIQSENHRDLLDIVGCFRPQDQRPWQHWEDHRVGKERHGTLWRRRQSLQYGCATN